MSSIHPDLISALNLAYTPSGLLWCNIKKEEESEEYGACTFEISCKSVEYSAGVLPSLTSNFSSCFIKKICFRVAKITPTKIGQFVTLWKRSAEGPIIPFDFADDNAFYVISARSAEQFGQFVFSKKILQEKGVLSKKDKGGKRAMRVYPPWDITDNRQAANSQKWQLEYFFEIYSDGQMDLERLKRLFSVQ